MPRILPAALSILFGILAAACHAEPQVTTMPKPEIIAHRGASGTAPENTVAAYKLAWEQGAHAAEVDIWITADGHVVCLHDQTTKRTAAGGIDLDVTTSTYEQLRALDVGSWKNARYAGEPIPLLSEVLDTIPPGTRFFVEIKDGPHIVEPLREVLLASGKMDQLVIISFDVEVLDRVVEVIPELPALYLIGAPRNSETNEYELIDPAENAYAKAKGYAGINVSWRGVTQELVDAAHEQGYELYVWTVNDVAEARRLVDMGITGITTDWPDRMLREFHSTATGQ